MKIDHILAYLPFLLIIVAFLVPIKHPQTVLQPNALISTLQDLNIIQKIPQKETFAPIHEIFLLSKSFNFSTSNFTLPKITIIAHDKNGYFCFLNGIMYHEGQSGENFKVLKIGNDYVTLQTPIGRQTIYVTLP